MKPAAIYARVSTGEQDHSMQLEELRAMAAARGWRAEEFVDTGSGSKKDLPERARMLEEARRGRFGAVLVWRFDRFARSTQQLVEAMENFKSWGVEFVSLREGVDTTTPAGRFAFTVFAGIAEFEREIIRERVKAGLENAKRNGTRSGRPVGRPRVHVDVEEAELLLAQGEKWSAVARRMGVPRTTLKRAVKKARDND